MFGFSSGELQPSVIWSALGRSLSIMKNVCSCDGDAGLINTYLTLAA
ncbi:hypothetical protein QYE88_42395 [Enterobacter hormaechei subsp. steigerwaltii]|nr:hypothetical protein [Enterobacter hormaechei subsp. steigerwaltii]